MSAIYYRDYYFDKIIHATSKVPIVILIGARQVGKTTILNNLNVKKSHVYLHGQNPDNVAIFASYSNTEQWLKINLNKDLDGYIFIDEFQYIPDISTKLKVLIDLNAKLKVICTGSSSLNILQNVKESLSGRTRIIEVYSLSIGEYYLFNDNKLHDTFNKYDINTQYPVFNKLMISLLNEYLVFGGFPRQALEANHNDKVDMLNDIFRTYLQRDVRQFVENDDFVGFNKILRMLALQIGNLVNVNEVSQKSGLSYRKTEEYINLLEQMYIIKLIEPYYTNKRKVLTKMKKVYFTDIGMRNVIIKDFRPIDQRNDVEALFENFVLLELLKRSRQIYDFNYYRTIDGSEIDFIITTELKKIIVEVKSGSFKGPKNFRNIDAFLQHSDADDVYIINQDLNLKNEKYHFLPALLTGRIFDI